jgi:protein-S-isoprenylcysteine O-methyltransferase Ste14
VRDKLILRATLGLLNLVVVLGVAIFGSAGTLRFPEAWVFLSLFAACSLAVTLYLARNDPALLARRTHAGPIAEKELRQKLIQGVASLAFLATVILPGLDHRFGWSHAPPAIVALGDACILLGFLAVLLVFRENTYTSAIIEVASEQRVIDSGPYAIVRHPMYAGALVLVAGIPLALGSFVALATLPPFVAVLVGRLLEEERFLVERLPGYAAYTERTRHRLIPGVW